MFFSTKYKLFFWVLSLWLLISSVYYIDSLLMGRIIVSYEEAPAHKIFKYFVCFLLSLYMTFSVRNYHVLFLLFFLGLITLLFGMFSASVELYLVVMLTCLAMLGFVSTLPLLVGGESSLARVFVFSGLVVVFFSMLELTVFYSAFEQYWSHTGGIRSSSTLFNPNNMGLYIGACLILLPACGFRARYVVVIAALLAFALVASGSRTAWVSLLTTVLFFSFVRPVRFCSKLLRLLGGGGFWLVFFLFAFLGVYMFGDLLHSDNIDASQRGADMYTAKVRIESIVNYFEALDWRIIFPDFYGDRSDYVQDNFYLTVLNSFGVVLFICFSLFFLVGHSFISRANPELLSWRFLVLYYLISGLSGSFLNSFPNNQLFFIALGSIFVPLRLGVNKLYGNSKCGDFK